MYLLIVGSPRSGTTLFASMIGMHSDVAMLIEDRFFAIKKLMGKKVLANKLCIPNQIEISQRANYLSRPLRRMGFMPNHSMSKFNIEDYLKLKDLKILTIIRDPNDVISSIMKRGKKEEKIAQERWCRAIEIIDYLQTEHADKTATISYEDLVNEPEKLIRKVAAFLDLEFQPAMLDGYKYNILYPGEDGIDKSKAYKSKAENREKRTFEISQDIMNKYNKLVTQKIVP